MQRMLKMALVDALALGLFASLPGMPVLKDAVSAATLPANPQVISVSGTVVDSSGKPVAGAIVHRLHHHHPTSGTGPATQPSHRRHHHIVTDANGNFTLPHVRVGATIIAFKLGSGVGTATAGSGSVTITLAPHHHK